MPDYPSTNINISYFKILYSIIGYYWTSPVLVQATLMGFFLSATFTSFWTTLTFLLSGDPYHYPTLTIGLFSLAGLTPMFLGPLYSRYMIDKFVPQLSILVSLSILIIGVSIGTYIGTFSVAGPIIQAALQDFGLQMTQIANRTAIYSVAPKARNRINTGYMIGVFCGQLMGTSVGNRIYSEGGWILTGSVSLAFIGAALIICLLRGPAEKGWIGWHGGIRIRRAE
jgi:MFS family permease